MIVRCDDDPTDPKLISIDVRRSVLQKAYGWSPSLQASFHLMYTSVPTVRYSAPVQYQPLSTLQLYSAPDFVLQFISFL